MHLVVYISPSNIVHLLLIFTDMSEGIVGDMGELGITESLSVKRQVIVSASEAAEMILRVDDILKAAPRKRTNDHHPC